MLSNLKGPGFHTKHTRRLTKKKVKEVAGKFSNTDWTLPSKKERGKTSGLRAKTTNNNNKTLKKGVEMKKWLKALMFLPYSINRQDILFK